MDEAKDDSMMQVQGEVTEGGEETKDGNAAEPPVKVSLDSMIRLPIDLND